MDLFYGLCPFCGESVVLREGGWTGLKCPNCGVPILRHHDCIPVGFVLYSAVKDARELALVYPGPLQVQPDRRV